MAEELLPSWCMLYLQNSAPCWLLPSISYHTNPFIGKSLWHGTWLPLRRWSEKVQESTQHRSHGHCEPILGVTYHHFCHISFIRSKSLDLVHVQGGRDDSEYESKMLVITGEKGISCLTHLALVLWRLLLFAWMLLSIHANYLSNNCFFKCASDLPHITV
jgi:hypothetical protein